MSTKRKIILSIIGVVVFIYLAVYTVLTPFIRGVVIDETTGQPVESAWVMATASIGTRTIAGDVGGTFLISRPHLRTGKDGVFYIFPKLYPTIPTPFTFGNEKKRLNVIIRVMDGKRAEVDLTKNWWMRVLFAVTSVKFVDRKEDDIYGELAAISGYCTAGGFGFLQMNRSEKCDSWELDYAIEDHERYLEKIFATANISQQVHYSTTLYRLSLLYERKNDFKKALELIKKVQNYDLKQGLSLNLKKYDGRIIELENKLKK